MNTYVIHSHQDSRKVVLAKTIHRTSMYKQILAFLQQYLQKPLNPIPHRPTYACKSTMSDSHLAQLCPKYCRDVSKTWWADDRSTHQKVKNAKNGTWADLPFFTWYVDANTSWRWCCYVGFDYRCKLSQDLFHALKTAANVAINSNSQTNGTNQSTFCRCTFRCTHWISATNGCRNVLRQPVNYYQIAVCKWIAQQSRSHQFHYHLFCQISLLHSSNSS